MIDEKVLASALHELAERDDTGAPPVAGLLRRGHRARLGRGARTATVAAAASVLVAGGVAAAVADRGEPGPVPLALAAQTTTRSAFHFRLEATLVPAIHAIRRHGGYDPVHNSAYWQTDPMGPREFFFAERQIGADCYYFHGPDGPWTQVPTCMRLTDSPETASLGQAGNPAVILAELKQAGQVTYAGRTGKGRHAVDTYRFSYQRPGRGMGIKTETKTGTVDIDVASRRIVKISYQVQATLENGQTMELTDVVLRLEDFGTRVDVPRPVIRSAR